MSRAAFIRHFQDKPGRSAVDLLTDIRMSLAVNELKKPAIIPKPVAESIGHRSEDAFRRVPADRMRMTSGNGAVWREGLLIARPAMRRGLQVTAA
jgi:AraC family transcriptional activator of mtrCDE